MNITSPQSDLGVSVSNETHFSSQRDKALKCECHLQSKGGTRNRAICRYSFVRYERYSLTATIIISKVLDKFNNNISFCFNLVGSLSLEIYLIHVLLMNYWKKYLFDWTISYTTMSFIFFFILVLLCSYLLSFIMKPISKYIKKYAQ